MFIESDRASERLPVCSACGVVRPHSLSIVRPRKCKAHSTNGGLIVGKFARRVKVISDIAVLAGGLEAPT